VFAPLGTKGLVPLLDKSVPVPPPAFVLLSTQLPKEQVERATESMLTLRSEGPILVGWGSPDSRQYARLADLAKRRPLKMALTPAALPPLRLGELINLKPLAPELPRLEDLFQVP
jgi:hypothetical protein